MQSTLLIKYPLAIRILHWLMAIIIIGLIAAGLVMEGMARDNTLRPTIYSLHKSFGITILFLGLLRLGLRLRLGVPPLPDIIARSERWLAQSGHYLFYVFMIILPVSGYIMTNSFGIPVKWFGVALPRVLSTNISLGHNAAEFHAWAAYTLIGLITLHIAGVIKHYAKERINLLSRMM